VAKLLEARKTLTLQLANSEQRIKNAEESAKKLKAELEKKFQEKDAELEKANLTIS
jgi:hypothetical protein